MAFLRGSAVIWSRLLEYYGVQLEYYWSFAEEAQCHIFIYSAMPSSVITLLLNSQSIGIMLVDDLSYSPAHASFMRDLDYMDVILLLLSFPGSSLTARTNTKKEK